MLHIPLVSCNHSTTPQHPKNEIPAKSSTLIGLFDSRLDTLLVRGADRLGDDGGGVTLVEAVAEVCNVSTRWKKRDSSKAFNDLPLCIRALCCLSA